MAGLGQFLVTTGKLCLQRAAKSDTHFANTVFGVFIGIVFTSLVVVGAWPRALAPHDDELESEYEEMGSR